MSVTASGSRTLSYQWYKGSDAISGATSSSYTISNAGLSDVGSYTVKVTDKNGSVTSDPAEVKVTAIPLAITKQPAGVNITEGKNATLSVTASGSGTLSYQWYKGSDAISGATSSSYTISNAALSAAGNYKVVVTDQNGSITSDSAVVTVKEKATTETKPTEPVTKPTEAPTEPVAPTEESQEEYEEEEDETGAVVAAVKTSDTSPIVPVMVLLLVSGMVMCITVSDKKNDFIKK
ncbi:MAG: immunoglobulin domain-containing protein [Alistipes sp.]|nr:immunoglobulin domain-containing protein [Alistipes sp.]